MQVLLFNMRHLPGGKNVELLYFHAFLVDYMKSSLMHKNKKKKPKEKKKHFFFWLKKLLRITEKHQERQPKNRGICGLE